MIHKNKVWEKPESHVGDYFKDCTFIDFKDTTHLYERNVFIKCKFHKITIEHLNVTNCTFIECVFCKVNFLRSDIEHCTFQGCLLLDCNFFDTVFLGCYLIENTIRGSLFHGYTCFPETCLDGNDILREAFNISGFLKNIDPEHINRDTLEYSGHCSYVERWLEDLEDETLIRLTKEYL